ncbi:MAG: hypothetical protein JWQ71_621 [Pedosphaera sp.]|nr:hypothetical protein [Pedosphaera sp.]
MNAIARFCTLSKCWLRPMLMLAAFLPLINSSAQPAATLSITNQPTPIMKTFVILFHQAPRPLTDTDRQRLTEETIPWARRQNGAGHKLDPRILAPERALRGLESTAATPADASPVTALLFLEAHDLSEAAQVAESHPALRYGFSIEVRPWAPPIPGAPTAKTPTRP